MQDVEDILIDYVKDNKEKLYRIAFSYSKNEDAALDIVQESITKALKNINKLKEIQDNGVKVISLMTKSEDPEENSYVESIFKNSTVFEQIEDGYLVNFHNLEEAREYYKRISKEEGE